MTDSLKLSGGPQNNCAKTAPVMNNIKMSVGRIEQNEMFLHL